MSAVELVLGVKINGSVYHSHREVHKALARTIAQHILYKRYTCLGQRQLRNVEFNERSYFREDRLKYNAFVNAITERAFRRVKAVMSKYPIGKPVDPKTVI